MAKIFFIRGPLRRQEFPLKPEGFTMGRSPGNDVPLPDDSVSRRHARFFRQGEAWMVQDLGSLNGIRVNGELVREKKLMDRDVVVVGRSDIAFLERDDSEFNFDDKTGDLRRALKDKYTVERQLGAGAQADVFRARDGNGRSVAVKVLTRPADAGTGDVRRFLREARALMALRHPHIVEMLEVDECEGINYMVLEFLGGGSLEERIEAGRLPWRSALRMLGELARALVHAHARGIYHRDIKPANVMFRDDGSAVLSDFGIAQILETTRLTRTGMVFGTPYFMSPGRLSGEPATEQSDLYALGATVYVAITGQYPFPGAEVDDIIRAMKLGDAIPVHLLEPLVPAGLSRLVARLLRRSATDRIESASELLREIEQLPPDMADGPALEDRVGGVYRGTRFAYVTDVGVSYIAQEIEIGSMHTIKFVSPLVTMGRDFSQRLAALRDQSGCRVLARGSMTLLVAAPLTGKTVHEIHAECRTRRGLPLPVALTLGEELARRLADAKLPHGDVEPHLVAVSAEGDVTLLDAGYATLLEPATYAAGRRLAGKLTYAAPELLTGGVPTAAADAYALGAFLYWTITGAPHVEPGPQVERIEKIMSGYLKEEPLKTAGAPPELIDLVRRSLSAAAKKRPTAGEIAQGLSGVLRGDRLGPEKLAELVRSPKSFVTAP